MGEQLTLILYGGWLALSVARQWPGPLKRAIVRWDVFHLLPHWGFFSAPAACDFTFTRRFRHADGSLTDWEPISLAPPRPRGAWLWHPQLLPLAIARQCAAQTAGVSTSGERRGILHAGKYRLLVAFLSANVSSSGATAMQFIVYASRQHDSSCPPQITFLSEFHEL